MALVQLLERASFLQTLSEYATEARSGDGRLVLVSGESGMGKTALLEAFQQHENEARWLWGACDGLLTPRPLGPLFDIGAQLGGALGELPAATGRRGIGCSPRFLAELGSPGELHRGGDRGRALGRRGDDGPAELRRAPAGPDAGAGAGHLPRR